MSHDPSRSVTTYLSDFDDEDLIKRLTQKGYTVVKKGKPVAGEIEGDDFIPAWIEYEADRLYRRVDGIPKPVQRFLARIIGCVKP